MKIGVVDFERVTKHLTSYQEGLIKINTVKQSFFDKLKPFKEKMEEIIKQANNPEWENVDDATKNERTQEFQELQQIGIETDAEFKEKMREMNDELSKNVYDKLQQIIKEWAIESDIDMVVGSTEAIYVKDDLFSTDEIIKILKSKGLYV